jgi:alanine racemase
MKGDKVIRTIAACMFTNASGFFLLSPHKGSKIKTMPQNDIPLRPTYVEVSLARLADNLKAIRKKVAPAQVMPVVKANAYGHGLVPVARHLVAHGADMLGVAILDEGLALRQAGIEVPVLVLGGIQAEQIPVYLKHNLILTVASMENLLQIEATSARLGMPAQVHLKVDTGMGRLGVRYDAAPALLESSLQFKNVNVAGIFSHFANSDAADLAHAHLQLERFKQVLTFYQQRGLPRPLAHMANSGAVLQLPESYFDLVRPGIMLYGVMPSQEVPRTVDVRPALTWKTRPVLSKVLPPHEPVSYGSTWRSDHAVRILTLPVGYGDGYFRAFSNRGFVLVRGMRYPVVGRVCMDQFLVNVEAESIGVEEEVVLLGAQGQECLTAEELAEMVGTIGYEILTNISARVPRVYVNEDR